MRREGSETIDKHRYSRGGSSRLSDWATSASNTGVRGQEPLEKCLGSTPLRKSESAPFEYKLAELSKKVLATYSTKYMWPSTGLNLFRLTKKKALCIENLARAIV